MYERHVPMDMCISLFKQGIYSNRDKKIDTRKISALEIELMNRELGEESSSEAPTKVRNLPECPQTHQQFGIRAYIEHKIKKMFRCKENGDHQLQDMERRDLRSNEDCTRR